MIVEKDERGYFSEFHQYSFAVIYSASVDEKRKRNAKKRQGNVVSYDIDWIAESELYQIEYIISDNDGHSGKVSIEWLYEAMLGLDDNLKEVLLLKFWYKYSRKEMSQKLGVSEKTITNWKNKAFEYIKRYRRKRLNRDIRGP
ncbi:MAG: sigma-70 family RNA polymerase sigma factor [Clostridia bacterium]|nr:sigma-70 family RNA polymerase sigma factor [Clostridia bacterium]